MANLLLDHCSITAPRGQIIFSRVARRMVAAGVAHQVVEPAHVMPATRYFELLVMELADQYAKRGEEWFREHYKEHLS